MLINCIFDCGQLSDREPKVLKDIKQQLNNRCFSIGASDTYKIKFGRRVVLIIRCDNSISASGLGHLDISNTIFLFFG